MNKKQLRIVSLLPSATEIVACLGLTGAIVGRSHECDYPPYIQQLPVCTQPKFNPSGSSREIHDRVTDLLQSALSVYEVKIDLLQQLQPTHIITQDQCDVCACSLADVEQAASNLLGIQPQIISLQPNLLAEVWADIQRVADALGVDGEGAIAPLKSASNPEIIIFMPCGFDLERPRQDAMQLTLNTEWQKLQAVRSGKVYITDGNSYFNRPGPRLVDSLEILAEILHPQMLDFGYRGIGWQPL